MYSYSGLTLMGFKPIDQLKEQYYVKPASFIYPVEEVHTYFYMLLQVQLIIQQHQFYSGCHRKHTFLFCYADEVFAQKCVRHLPMCGFLQFCTTSCSSSPTSDNYPSQHNYPSQSVYDACILLPVG